MKRKSLACVLVALLMICSSVFVGCDAQTVKADNYLENTQVKQESQTISTDDGEKIIEAKFISKTAVGDYEFLVYKIGEIKDCFIQAITDPIFNDDGTERMVLEKRELSSKSISKGISNSISTTEEVKTTQTNSNTLEWDFSVSNSTETSISAQAGIEVGIFEGSIEAGLRNTFTATAGIGGSTTNTTSKEIGRQVTESLTNSYDVSEVEEKGQSVTIEYNFDKYEKGYYYTLSLVADIDVHQVIVYNSKTEEFLTTYFAASTTSIPAIRMLSSSKEDDYKISENYKLKPIENIDVKEAKSKPIKEILENPGWEKFSENMTKYNCAVNTLWDKTTKGLEVWDNLHKNWELGNLSFYGVQKNENKFTVKNKDALSIKYQLLQNISKLPTNNVVTSQVLGYLGWNKVVGTNISTSVGYGAYWVRVTYADDTQFEKNATNFLNGKNQGDFIELLSADDVDLSKTLEKIEVVVVYNTAAGFKTAGLWRCEYTCNFN